MTMKKNIFFILFCTILFFYATNSSAQAANAVVGVWKNGEGTAMVQIFEKSDKFYGKIVWLKIPK